MSAHIIRLEPNFASSILVNQNDNVAKVHPDWNINKKLTKKKVGLGRGDMLETFYWEENRLAQMLKLTADFMHARMDYTDWTISVVLIRIREKHSNYGDEFPYDIMHNSASSVLPH